MNKRPYIDSVDIDLHVARDSEEFAEEAAAFFVACSKQRIRESGVFVVALSGGNTPAPVLDILARKYNHVCEWNIIHFFWSDERSVAPDHERSNYHMAKIHLLDKIDVPRSNIHRIPTEFPPSEASVKYSDLLRKFFHLNPGQWPSFDLIFLGLGENGHTASLFPENPALKNLSDLIVPVKIPEAGETRFTLTYPVINAAKNVVVLASGEEKSKIVRSSLMTPPDPEKLPIQGVHPSRGKLTWYLDIAAARNLEKNLN